MTSSDSVKWQLCWVALIWHVTMLHKGWHRLLVWGTYLNMTLVTSMWSVLCRLSDPAGLLKVQSTIILSEKLLINNYCSKQIQNRVLCQQCCKLVAVSLHYLSTSVDIISWLSDFLFYNVPPLFTEPHLLKWQTHAARNTGLPLQLLLHPPFHCLGSSKLTEWTVSSPHGTVMDLNH